MKLLIQFYSILATRIIAMKWTFSNIIILSLFPTLIFAHGSHGSGFIAGFTHPILGLDHNLAILGIGTLSYFLDQKRWYLYPLSFLTLMIIGGTMGIGQEATTVIEKIIALSVFIIGLFHLKKVNSGNALTLVLVATFGFFHGFAHGAEMPETTTALKYISGFSVGMIILSVLGYFIGKRILLSNDYFKYYTLISGILLGAGIVFLWP